MVVSGVSSWWFLACRHGGFWRVVIVVSGMTSRWFLAWCHTGCDHIGVTDVLKCWYISTINKDWITLQKRQDISYRWPRLDQNTCDQMETSYVPVETVDAIPHIKFGILVCVVVWKCIDVNCFVNFLLSRPFPINLAKRPQIFINTLIILARNSTSVKIWTACSQVVKQMMVNLQLPEKSFLFFSLYEKYTRKNLTTCQQDVFVTGS
jgi:hypothetical protein